MNETLITTAYRSTVVSKNCSVDDILVTPGLRRQFVETVQKQAPQLTETYCLRRLLYLRKKGKLPRSRVLIGEKGHE